MLPIIEVPQAIASGMAKYRDVFCREEGFEHVCRYVTGLVISPNKTLQGIYDLQVWEGESPSRRAMHDAVFEAGWDSDEFIFKHRATVAVDHHGRGKEVIDLDWTFAHHEKGPQIYGVLKGYDYVEGRTGRFITVVTAVISNPSLIDGLDVVVQQPNWEDEEVAYLNATTQESYEQMDGARTRLLELLHHKKHQLAYKKRTEIALEIVQQIEQEGHFPHASYAFDNGVLTLPLTRFIESCDKHWVSEIECSRHIQWRGEWKRSDEIDKKLRTDHQQSFRPIEVKCRNGETKRFWAFTKVVRLKWYGRK